MVGGPLSVPLTRRAARAVRESSPTNPPATAPENVDTDEEVSGPTAGGQTGKTRVQWDRFTKFTKCRNVSLLN